MTSAASPHGVRAANREWPSRAAVYVTLLAGVGVGVAAIVILGWYLRVPELVQFSDDLVAMRINSAVGLALVALSLLVPHRWRPVPAGLALLLMLVILLQHAVGTRLGVDELLVDDWADPPVEHPGEIAVNTAVCIALLAVAVLTTHWRRWLAELATIVALAVAFVAIFGYSFGTVRLYRLPDLTPMAINTAMLVVLVGVAVGLSIPGGTFQWITFGRDWGARLQRALLPVGIVVLPSVAWLFDRGVVNGTYNSTVAFTLLVSLVAIAVTLIGFVLGREAREFDAEQQMLVEELFRLNEQLEDRVRARSMQINRQRTRLALLEERDRIARDLHDRVIQRIFAAGLQVAALGRTARKFEQEQGTEGVLGESLNGVARELDMAIRELRNSIFELTSIDDHDDVEQVLHDIASRASRILGFMPKVEAEGAIAGLAPDLVAQVASVIQEALSNIARHARASTAEVRLVGTDSDLTVRVTDDGIGLPDPLPRSSGISNLMNRARNLGGTATWTPNEPTGTVLTWRVPRRPGDELLPESTQAQPTEPAEPADR
jgi:signal transduction histidine kinase